MTKPVSLPNTFGTQSGTIPLNYLDQDFTAVTNSLNDLATYSNYAADTGSVNNFIANFSTGIVTSALTTGLRLQFKAANTNTGASTLQVQVNTVSIGTAAIRLTDGSALPANTIVSGAIVDVLYDGTNFQLLNDASGGGQIVTDLTVTGNLAVTGTSTLTGNVTIQGTENNIQGNLTVGNVTILGNSNISGNISGGNLSVTSLTSTGNISITGSGIFKVGNVSYSDTGVIASFQSNVAGYNQIILQNTSAAANASTNFNISNNAGTASTNFGEFGINSSAFTGSGSFSTPNNVYLASASTDLVIGTYAANSVRFVVNSGTTDAMQIGTTGLVGIGTTTPASKLNLAGNLSFAPWTTAAPGLRIDAITFTSSSTLTGTVVANSIGSPTFASTTAAQVVTTGATLYIAGSPAAGSNVSYTNKYALYIADGALNDVYIGGARLKVAATNGTYPAADFGTTGVGFSVGSGTYTSAAGYSGTVAVNSFTAALLSATSASQTITDAATLYISGAPTALLNTTITNRWSLYLATGNAYFGGVRLQIAGTSQTQIPAANFGIITGVGFSVAAATYTSAAGVSGSVAANTIGQATFAATTAAQTISAAYGLYLNAPAAGTNVTFSTVPVALYADGGVNINGKLSFSQPSGTTKIDVPSANWSLGALLGSSVNNFLDVNTAASATISAAYINSFPGATISTSNASITITNAATINVGAPNNLGSAPNTPTITRNWAINVGNGGINLSSPNYLTTNPLTASYASNTGTSVFGFGFNYATGTTATFYGVAATYTHMSGVVIHGFATGFANATTITNAANIFISGAPTPSTNATFTNTWGIYSLVDIGSAAGIYGATSTGRIGYKTGTGAGGAVTQATSRTTGVTLNTPTGAITMFSAAGSATVATFTVTNSSVAITDVIILNQRSGTNLYNFEVTAVAAGSFNITFNTTGGTAVDAPVINFAVIKGAAT